MIIILYCASKYLDDKKKGNQTAKPVFDKIHIP